MGCSFLLKRAVSEAVITRISTTVNGPSDGLTWQTLPCMLIHIMIAVIKTGGKQYVVKEGDELKIEKLTAGKGEDVSLEVLLVAESDGSKVDIGAPSLDRTVTAEVVAHGRSKKVEVVKYKPKVRYKKRTGHRQEFTKIKVKNIA